MHIFCKSLHFYVENIRTSKQIFVDHTLLLAQFGNRIRDFLTQHCVLNYTPLIKQYTILIYIPTMGEPRYGTNRPAQPE